VSAAKVIEEVQITNATIIRLSDSIIHLQWKRGVELEISDIDEMIKAFEEMSKGQLTKVISEFSPFVTISSKAREYAAANSPDLIALAYVIHGLSQRIIIRFFIRIKKKKHPTKVCLSFDEAVNWIENY
jgi:hypothetical protein